MRADSPALAAKPAVTAASCLYVAWVTDAAYVQGTCMSIFSASRQTLADAVFVVLMPPDDLAKSDWSALRGALRPNHSLRILAAADPRVETCIINSTYISRTTYLRFLLPAALPDVERCIYLDGDALVLDDLSRLWEAIDWTAPVSAARDLFIAAEGVYMRSLGLHGYFNSGVMGLNLQAWRAGGYADACFRLASSTTLRRRYNDQDVLNLVFAGRVAWFDPRWNISTTMTGFYAHDTAFVSKTEWRRMRKHPGLAHYTRPRKPWHGAMEHSLAWEYWKLAAVSPWRAEYAPRRAKARRHYLAARWKRWRRWLFRFAKRRDQHRPFLMLCGWKIAFR